jgi:hypothetical protein
MMQRANRTEKRVFAALPVNLEGGSKGITRDVSASGIFFETDIENTTGSLISFTLEFEGPSGGMTLKCLAEVLRVESVAQQNGRVGVAAKIIDSKFEARH